MEKWRLLTVVRLKSTKAVDWEHTGKFPPEGPGGNPTGSYPGMQASNGAPKGGPGTDSMARTIP